MLGRLAARCRAFVTFVKIAGACVWFGFAGLFGVWALTLLNSDRSGAILCLCIALYLLYRGARLFSESVPAAAPSPPAAKPRDGTPALGPRNHDRRGGLIR
jgi:hypothetical protein